MTREEIDALIARLERASRANPRRHLLRIAGLVALVYAYLAIVLVGSLALCALMIVMVFYVPVMIKVAILGLVVFGGILSAALRGLWVKMEPPKGQPVTRAEAPRLFELLDELRSALHCQPFDVALIVPDVNAAVVQIPRLGIFGWHKNYLLLGLPLMQSLSPEEFKSVLAHEFAHSSGGHSRFGNWIYRVRQSWAQIFEQMSRRRARGRVVFAAFIKWFWPVFNAHAFVLGRANEYEADAGAARLAGADAAAAALIRVRVDGSLIGEKFWPEIFARSRDEKEPPAEVMPALRQTIERGPAPEDAARWLRHAFLMETNNADTHPSLKDRLRALGRLPPGLDEGKFPTAAPARPGQNAAAYYLGAHEETAMRQLSQAWRGAVTPAWAARHQQAQQLAGDLAKLEQPEGKPPDAAALWEKARKVAELYGDEAARPALEQALSLDVRNPAVNFRLGRLRLQHDDPSGVSFIETAMESDPALIREGCNLLYGYYHRTGQREKLRPLENRVDAFDREMALAQQERSRVAVADQFVHHGLPEERLAAVRELLKAEPDVFAAALARKVVARFPNAPCHVLALRVKAPWWKLRGASASTRLAQRLARRVRLPGNTLVFVLQARLEAPGRKVFGVPGAIFYQRG